MALIAAVVGGIGFMNIHKIDDADTFLYEKCTVALGQMCTIEGNFSRVRLNDYRTVVSASAADAKAAAARGEDLMKGIEAAEAGYARTLIDAEDELNFKRMKADLESYDKADPGDRSCTRFSQTRNTLTY